jgi:hypothetical protein
MKLDETIIHSIMLKFINVMAIIDAVKNAFKGIIAI